MMKTIDRRLQALEQQQHGAAGFAVWVGGEDDTDMLGPNGETMSRAAFDVLYPDAVDLAKGSDDEEPR
jgi:hypothetical protein